MAIDRYRIESEEKWRERCDAIPFIEFPKGWKVKIIPPFAGAIARFLVKLPKSNSYKSIYLDFDNRLGYYGNPPEPYWEVHPVNGDVGRCDMADTKALLKLIRAKE